jgi:TPR repeat protein
MYNLGVLLNKRGEQAEAETWYRKAADTGHAGAMSNLGVLLAERGEQAEAETWYRKAADTGHASAMYNLGGPPQQTRRAGRSRELVPQGRRRQREALKPTRHGLPSADAPKAAAVSVDVGSDHSASWWG